MSQKDKPEAVYDSSHVVYLDLDTGNLEVYKRRTRDAALDHSEKLKALNRRTASMISYCRKHFAGFKNGDGFKSINAARS